MHATSAPPGSSLYYSIMHADNTLKANILLYRSIYEKLKKIKPVAVSWWEQELQKHPDLLPLLHAFINDLNISIYEDNLNLHQFYKNTAGLLERSLGKFYGISDDKKLDQLENLGIFNAKINHLRDLKKHLEQGKMYFSGEQLLKYHVNLYDLSQLKLTPAILQLFEDEAEHSLSYFTPVKDKNARPTLILANIQKTLLSEIKKADFPVFTHHIGLTPLRKWWIANRS